MNNDKLLFADSTDEDVASAKVNELSNNQKLIAELQVLLNKNYSKDAVQIIVNNDEAEEFYARKNFQAKLEILAGLVIGVVVLYGLYKYHKKDAGTTGNSQEAGGSNLHNDKEPQAGTDSIAQSTKIDLQSSDEDLADEIDPEDEEEEVPVVARKRSNYRRPFRWAEAIDPWLEEEVAYDEEVDEDYEPSDEEEGWQAYA